MKRAPRIFLIAAGLLAAPLSSAELTILTPATWDAFIPAGKEVDAVYGDFVLRNDHIVAVIANPHPGRYASLALSNVGGAVIDLTERHRQNDLFIGYYPGTEQLVFRLDRITVEGSAILQQAGYTTRHGNHFSLDVRGDRLNPGTSKPAPILQGKTVTLECRAAGSGETLEGRLIYTLRDGAHALEIRTEYANHTEKTLEIAVDYTLRSHPPEEDTPGPGMTLAEGETRDRFWWYSRWWGQAYGLLTMDNEIAFANKPGNRMDRYTFRFSRNGRPKLRLRPGNTHTIRQFLIPAANTIALRYKMMLLTGGKTGAAALRLTVRDTRGAPVPNADVVLRQDDAAYGEGRTDDRGILRLDLPPGAYTGTVSAIGSGSKDFTLQVRQTTDAENPRPVSIELPAPARVEANITGEDGGPIPCKVQFIGVEGTPDPFFFPRSGEHTVHNLYYSHDGRFLQPLPPGTYDVLISHGGEYDLEKVRLSVAQGETVPLRATLRRTVHSPGWITTDFHSHSTPSGDNYASQRGRVLNLLCENMEFAPCTEHQRIDTYVPHLQALGVEHLMATTSGMELNTSPGGINHQNAFPLRLYARRQRGGAPAHDRESAENQIHRLASWDNYAEKLVQVNHPDIVQMFFDRDNDGIRDGGFNGMFAWQDVMEVHPIDRILEILADPAGDHGRNRLYHWLRLMNQGWRLPGTANTDAHYNHHGSGTIYNYVKSFSDDPAQIDSLDIVRAAKAGHIIMTNGPFLEVTVINTDGRRAIPGDDLPAPGGRVDLQLRVQCANWQDIDRVQVLLNGRAAPEWNWTRATHPTLFGDTAIKFDRTTTLHLTEDTHIIVVAIGEHASQAPVMGEGQRNVHPAAVSNPVFVDVDGGGFTPNGDTLGRGITEK